MRAGPKRLGTVEFMSSNDRLPNLPTVTCTEDDLDQRIRSATTAAAAAVVEIERVLADTADHLSRLARRLDALGEVTGDGRFVELANRLN